MHPSHVILSVHDGSICLVLTVIMSMFRDPRVLK